jgi:hypothetical protein
VQQQIAAIEEKRDESPPTCKETEKKRAQLLLSKGIGPTGLDGAIMGAVNQGENPLSVCLSRYTIR